MGNCCKNSETAVKEPSSNEEPIEKIELVNLQFDKKSLEQVTSVWAKLPIDKKWHPAIIIDERLIEGLEFYCNKYKLKIPNPPTNEILKVQKKDLFLVYVYGLEEW
jgi:hypothetical protein